MRGPWLPPPGRPLQPRRHPALTTPLPCAGLATAPQAPVLGTRGRRWGWGGSGLCRPWCWSLCLGCFFTWKTTSLPGPNASPPELKPLDPRHRENAEQPLVSRVPSSPVVAQGPFAHAAFSPDCKRSGGSARSEVNRASGAAPRSPASVSVCEMLEGMNK